MARFGFESTRRSVKAMAEKEVPFFAQDTEDAVASEADLDALTEEEEVELAVKEEMRKTRVVSNLRNANGVDYAPWMGISAEDEAKIRQLMKEKTAARRARQEQERSVSGNLYYDSQAQELSGTGLNYKIIDGQVELEWATKQERNTQGFVVKRRPAKTEDFTQIASYEDFGPLCSQGPDGGIYRYLDDTVSPGGWVYRITEADDTGAQADLCQCLVEVQTQEEQQAALIAGVGIAAFAVIAVVAGIALDPMGGY
eukprot:CAMPEP_0185737240 /NCGR_PEP_ID=MMETSP1171-20130828/29966_1 /TAXON_ID=374046 /ORGANISM="Helicotheca tamensis, Strain CCMP826" /LENGTH=254 /DNA_ID=CAMNT_0028408115 /DNA_START=245 /DNA_END=1009 /DNA_ORIENTATION=+